MSAQNYSLLHLMHTILALVQPTEAIILQLTFDLDIICLWLFHQQRRRFAVQWIRRVGVSQKLWKEDLEDVDHVVHR